MSKLASLRRDFSRSILRLEEALALPKDAIVRDSAIRNPALPRAGADRHGPREEIAALPS
jgi:hypothetical protein